MATGFLGTSWLWNGTLLGTNVSPFQGTVEDDVPFTKAGYVIVPWRLLEILAN